MLRSTVFSAFILLQAAILLAAGLATLFWSQELMMWLIHLLGEERTLGAENVITDANGDRLLTNPGVMALYMSPFVILGVTELLTSWTLIYLWMVLPSDAVVSNRPQ